MGAILRPRRGTKAVADSKNFVLAKGEIFFEVPSGGVGKGLGRIKMGDGSTAYKNLPYFQELDLIAATGLDSTSKSTIRTNIGAGTSNLALGSSSSTAYRGDRGTTAYNHSQATHARTDATAVAASSTNGNIKINGTETTVYTHPGSGTNPHGTTKSDVGLGNVGNFKAVCTVASQGLSDTEKSNARANIGAGTSSLALGTTSSTAYRGDYGNTAYTHSQSTHARTDATCVAASTTNGKIKINGTETTVYTHPGNGTNPHGTTKSDVGLGNVGNFKAVSTVASQGLSDTEKSNARTNIAAASAADVTQLNNDITSINNNACWIWPNGNIWKGYIGYNPNTMAAFIVSRTGNESNYDEHTFLAGESTGISYYHGTTNVWEYKKAELDRLQKIEFGNNVENVEFKAAGDDSSDIDHMGLYYDQLSTGAQWHLEFDHDKMIYRHYLNNTLIFDKYITYGGASRILNRMPVKANSSDDWREAYAMNNTANQKIYFNGIFSGFCLLLQGAGWGSILYFVDITNYHVNTACLACFNRTAVNDLFTEHGGFSNAPIDIPSHQFTFNVTYSGTAIFYSFNADW